MSYTNIIKDLNSIRTVMKNDGNLQSANIELLDLDTEQLKDNTILIDMDLTTTQQYADGDSDMLIDIYAYHSSRLNAIELRQYLIDFMSELQVGCMRMEVIEDDEAYNGMLETTAGKYASVSFKVQVMK